MPSKRALRGLLQFLIDHTEQNSLKLNPPRMLTQAAFLETSLQFEKPLVSHALSLISWMKALESFSEIELSALLISKEKPLSPSHLLGISKSLSSAWKEIAASGKTISETVLEVSKMGFEREVKRWEVIEKIYFRYLEVLNNYQVCDRETAILSAISKNKAQKPQ